MIETPSFGPSDSLDSVGFNFQVLQNYLYGLQAFLQGLSEPPAAGTVKVLIQNENGELDQFTLVAGAGVTITPNLVTKQWTISSP